MTYLVKYYKRNKKNEAFYKRLHLGTNDVTFYNTKHQLIKLKDIIKTKDPRLELWYKDLTITVILYLI